MTFWTPLTSKSLAGFQMSRRKGKQCFARRRGAFRQGNFPETMRASVAVAQPQPTQHEGACDDSTNGSRGDSGLPWLAPTRPAGTCCSWPTGSGPL